MDKKKLSERDICTKFITPALEQAGWDKKIQFKEEVTLTDGRIFVAGRTAVRQKKKRADYVLYYKPNIPLAVIEAKDNNHSLGDGMQQALGYSEILDIPFVFSSNGDGFLFHDKTVTGQGKLEQELSLNDFPSPENLWDKYSQFKGLSPDQEKVFTQDYFYEQDGISPRYYQTVAINRITEAIAKGQDRILVVMATGTGKTFVAYQSIYRLWKAGIKKRILFLADRHILLDQARTNDFRHFGDKMTKITNQNADKSYEVYLALYQSLTGNENTFDLFKQFSPSFFDMIVIDECHRGSARDDAKWREVLTYFNGATQIGLTATPKETKEVSNIEYFGDPVYTYSLRQGIDDGFLAPYKVIRVFIDKDLEGYRPEKGKLDRYGNEIEDREYNVTDYDKNLVLEQRTELVAKKVSDYLKENNSRFDKTIFFCVDIDHAERMRQFLVNENPDLASQNSKYVMRITGDNAEGKAQLDNFIDPAEQFPTLVTTSKLLTTGVDAKTCKLIVLDSNINSMTEFKQIIGRGTRIREDYDKLYFTIIDFRSVTKLFADPDFDGDPVKIKETTGRIPTEDEDDGDDGTDTGGKPPKGGVIGDMPPVRGYGKVYVDDVGVKIIGEREQYYDKNGKLITEALKDYTKKTFKQEYAELKDFLVWWESSDKKTVILEELKEKGIPVDGLKKEVGKDFDLFDLICHVVYDKPSLTRRERADNVKKRNYFEKYGEKAKKVLEALLDKYADEGIESLESLEILKIDPFNELGSPVEIVKMFGDKDKYVEAIKDLEKELYSAS